MYQNTITVFNYHEATKLWYPSIISGVDLIASKTNNATTKGLNNGDTVDIIIHCTPDKKIKTSKGVKSYLNVNAYAKCSTPADCMTFRPEKDFIYDEVWPEILPINGDDYDSGLYNELNEKHDGIYMISSAAYYGLLPHFEIGGR